MKTRFQLSREGFVTAYMTTTPRVVDFKAPYELKDQLEFEKQMRNLFYEEPECSGDDASLGEISAIGTPWTYYAQNRNTYIDYTKFYFTLSRITILARTALVSERARDVRIRVWSYAAFDIWLDGKRVATEKVPVYQPIRHTDLTLSLKEGENDLFIYIQNFGVRDTRNMLAIQVLDTDGITVTLPIEEEKLARLSELEEWFYTLRSKDTRIVAQSPPPTPVAVKLDKESAVWEKDCSLDVKESFSVKLSCELFGQKFSRVFERYEFTKPPKEARNCKDVFAYNAKRMHEKLVTSVDEIGYLYESTLDHSRCYAALCRIASDPERRITECDKRAIRTSLEAIDRRVDCSDFGLSCLFRMMQNLDLPEDIRGEIKEVALRFRYWMDEDGADAMCFWSENHSLLFYGCQMVAGKLFPNDRFLRSGRLGKEQYEIGVRRLNEWFDIVEEEGFEEFLAGGYLGVTIVALLGVYDFADESLRARAKGVMDRIVYEAAVQCFRGVHMAPMGRIYRGALIPYSSSIQGLLYMLSDENASYFYSWYSAFCFSDYLLPSDLDEVMRGSLDKVFTSGRAEIHTKKTKNYLLTSVTSPRKEAPKPPKDTSTEYYRTVLMNESFHGTTLFAPGVDGYQQHLMYAAISDRFYTFINLPGAEKDFCGMRPGYWYGNLVFPALKQEGNELFCRYIIPDRVPTKFTHAYFPAYAADEVTDKDGFRFARVGDGYLALWCSQTLELNNNDAVVDADLRAYGDDVCWYIRVGERSTDGSFDDFVKSCLDSGITRAYIENKLS